MVDALGKNILTLTKSLQEFVEYLLYVLKISFVPPFRWKDIAKQLVFVANESAIIVFICVSFAAGVVIVESAFHMNLLIQNHSMVPGFAAMLILRELGAVVTCLLLTSRIGAGWAAEVGSMQVTEQIDALKMLGMDPVRFLVVPRFIASVLGAICLVIMANLICLTVAMFVSTIKLDFTAGAFLTAMRTFISKQDIIFAVIKGASFGAVIPLISCFYGFRCKAGAEGVGLATTNAVVAISVAIIGIDFILTWIFSYFY